MPGRRNRSHKPLTRIDLQNLYMLGIEEHKHFFHRTHILRMRIDKH